MGELSFERSKEIHDRILETNANEAAEHFGLSIESILRYDRWYRNAFNEEPPPVTIPKVLLFDIETLPLHVRTWTLFKPRINHQDIIKDWCMLSWSAKWLFDNQMHHAVLTPDEAVSRNDKRICISLLKYFEEADFIIAHNLKRFDRKRSNTRFKLNGLQPPSPYQLIDTLEIARKEFSFSSNRLDYLGRLMCNDEKLHNEQGLWIRCDNGDPEALVKMSEYNDQDVKLLEEVYLELRPWMTSHPNLAVYGEGDSECCHRCLGEVETCGTYGTPAGRFEAYRCLNPQCGGIGRRRFNTLTKEEKNVLTTSVAR